LGLTGRFPRFFSHTRKAVTVVDDQHDDARARPERVEEVEALLNKEIAWSEAALVRAENETAGVVAKLEDCQYSFWVARSTLTLFRFRECLIAARKEGYVALATFSKMPQPVSRIVARLEALPSNTTLQRRLPLLFALYRQSKRELARLAALKGPTCGDSSSLCAFAFDEATKARQAALERVYGTVIAPTNACMFRRRDKMCVNEMLRAFEALPVKSSDAVNAVIDRAAGTNDTWPVAKQLAMSEKLDALVQAFSMCGLSRACKMKLQWEGAVRYLSLRVRI
jgi:hypothetical protein